MAVVLMRARVLLPLALACAAFACGRDSRTAGASTTSSQHAVTYAGPQALVLRIPRGGGAARANAYPRIDSVAWTGDPAPTPAEVLAFDDESGSVAYRDQQGRAVLLELRLGTITVDSNPKLSNLVSSNGSAIFGIKPDGSVIRLTPTGEWLYKPTQPATGLYPEPDGELLIAMGTGAKTRIIKVFPPDRKVLEDLPFPVASKVVQTSLGDRLYLAVDSGLAVLRTRTMDWGAPVHLSEPIVVMASSPSGDRIFALTDSRDKVTVIDRFRESVTERLELPGKAQDLRVDPFGRYLLAKSAASDSIWIIAIGTARVIGAARSGWRSDLPFVGYDGAIATLIGDDVVVIDGETLKPRNRSRGGASDFWYPFLWDGFRPRSALLDEPVRFDSVAIDPTQLDSIRAANRASDSTGGAATAATADTAGPRGFIVSFASFSVEQRARDLASRIHVGGENARVVTLNRNGQTVYRVILGPFLTRDEADRAGRESRQSYWVFEGEP